jgi:DNA-binding NtrC family response regulator
VTFTAGEEEMLFALGSERAQLLIIDGPGREDLNLLARARAVRPALKIVVTTEGLRAVDSLSDEVAVLAKPFTLAELAGTVRRTLDSSGPGP